MAAVAADDGGDVVVVVVVVAADKSDRRMRMLAHRFRLQHCSDALNLRRMC